MTGYDPEAKIREAVAAGALDRDTRIPQVPVPPRRPASAASAVVPGPAAPSVTAPVPTPQDQTIPGSPKGSMRQVTLYVSASTAEAISAARGPDESLGGVVMSVLRSAYTQLVAQHQVVDVSDESPFPSPTPRRRRLVVPDARPLSIRVTPAEAAAMRKVADELDTSVSRMVDDAAALSPRTAGRVPGPGSLDDDRRGGAPAT